MYENSCDVWCKSRRRESGIPSLFHKTIQVFQELVLMKVLTSVNSVHGVHQQFTLLRSNAVNGPTNRIVTKELIRIY